MTAISQRWFALFMRATQARNEHVFGPVRRALLQDVRGEVLEIGAGLGANCPYYGGVDRLIAVEPNVHMRAQLEASAIQAGMELELREGFAEALPLDDASVDTVVCTHVLCSVDRLDASLAEIRRVLRPGGRFYFLEHVADCPGTLRRRVQDAVCPAWRAVGDGCRPNRETWRAIENAGFAHVHLEHRAIPLGFWHITPHITGVTTA